MENKKNNIDKVPSIEEQLELLKEYDAVQKMEIQSLLFKLDLFLDEDSDEIILKQALEDVCKILKRFGFEDKLCNPKWHIKQAKKKNQSKYWRNLKAKNDDVGADSDACR